MSYTVEELIEVGRPIAMTALVEAAAERHPITYSRSLSVLSPCFAPPWPTNILAMWSEA